MPVLLMSYREQNGKDVALPVLITRVKKPEAVKNVG